MPRVITDAMYKRKVKSIHDNSVIVVGRYKGNRHKIKHKCNKGHTWSSTPSNVVHATNPTGCPFCSHRSFRYTEKEIRNILKKNNPGYKLLDSFNNIRDKITFKCPEGHVFITTARIAALSGHGCPKCTSRTRGVNLAYTWKDIQAKLDSHKTGIRILASSFTHQTKPADFVCSKGHSFTKRARFILDKTNKGGCPYCDKSYNQSYIVRECLSAISSRIRLAINTIDKGGEFVVKGVNYRLDGYNKRFNIGFEFHGNYFHGYNGKKITSLKRYMKTILRQQLLHSHVSLITVWEYEWMDDPVGVLERVAQRVNEIKRQQQSRLPP